MKNRPSASAKECMLAGEFYDSRDKELLAMNRRAKRLIRRFNAIDPEEMEAKAEILQELLGAVGRYVWIEPPFYCDYGEHITIDEHTFINMNCVFLDAAEIAIGKKGLIGPAVQIYSAYHPLAAEERIRKNWSESEGKAVYRTQAAPVHIGDHCWIGGSTVIMPGVTIGDNTVIGAGSVVTRDIPSNVLAVGSPCKVIRDL